MRLLSLVNYFENYSFAHILFNIGSLSTGICVFFNILIHWRLMPFLIIFLLYRVLEYLNESIPSEN